MLNAVIIDDESQARSALKYEIREHCPQVNLVGEAYDVKSGIDIIKQKHPDVIFLDIRLTDGLGFDILKEIKNESIKIIFTTAHSQYALKAIKFSALDYLLKPVSASELKSAIEKISSSNFDDLTSFEAYLHNLTADAKNKKIAISTSSGIHLIALQEIIYCQSEGNYTKIVFKDGKNMVSAKTLKGYEELLSPYGFVRIHLSYLINIEHLISYNSRDNGSVTLLGNHTFPVAQRKKTFLLQILNSYNK